MKKKQILLIAAGAAAAAIAIGVGAFFATHTRVAGRFLKNNQQYYDLTDVSVSVEDFDAICAQFPDAEIAWMVPFQGKRISPDAETLTVDTLSAEDVEILSRFPKLAALDASACRDLDTLLLAAQTYPNCVVTYKVPFGEAAVLSTDRTAKAAYPGLQAVEAAMPYLPTLEEVRFTGEVPLAELMALRQNHPEVSFYGDVRLGEKLLSADTETLELTDGSVNAQELGQVIPALQALKTVVLTQSGLTDAEIKTLADANPEVFFLWDMTVAGKQFSTDAEEVDISGTQATVEEAESILPYFPNLKKVVMVGCGIDNETMEALNLRHEDVQYVWAVKVRDYYDIRTDAEYFYPWQLNASKDEPLYLDDLKYCHDMIAMDVGHYWVPDCSFLYGMPHMRYLIIAMTGCHDITPVGCLKELEYLEVFEMEVDSYEPLLGCTALRDLNIGTTYADPTPLFQMTWLNNLYWYCGRGHLNHIEPGLADKLIDALPNTNVCFDLIRNCGNEWRYLPNYYIFREIINNGYLNQYSARAYWGDDMDAILACKFSEENDARVVLPQIVARRLAEGQYVPGLKNSGPKPKGTENGTP